jgi:type II secretory pathway pseudopilin PulG
MTRRQRYRRYRARLHRDERGFTIVETVVAITVIFGSLTALAYTATIGFRYVAIARERQAATGVSNQVIEGVRALAWDRFKLGLRTADVVAEAADPAGNIKQCGGVYYRTKTCSPLPNAQQRIIHTPNLPVQCASSAVPCPLVPNSGTVSGPGYPLPFTWRVYVTNANPNNSPYTVTVEVSWTPPSTGLASYLRTQSLFYSPDSSAGSETHPYAGPVQPQFIASATANPPTVLITPNAGTGATFAEAQLIFPSARSDATVEQVAKISGAAAQAGAEHYTVSGGARTGFVGLASLGSLADGNPSTPATEYSMANTLGGVPIGTTTVTNAGNGARLTLGNINDGGATASSVSAVAPTNTTTSACPLTSTPFAQQTDGIPCGSSMSRMNGTLTATLDIAPAIGLAAGTDGWTATLFSASAPPAGTPSVVTLVDQRTDPPDSENGLLASVQRNLGAIGLVGLPAATACTTQPAGWTGYAFSVANYRDQANAAAGPSATTLASDPIGGGGASASAVSFYNGSGYTTVSGNNNLRQPGSYVTPATISCSASVGSPSRPVLVEISFPDGNLTRAGKSLSSTGSNPRTLAQAAMGSPVAGNVQYKVFYNGALRVDLTLKIDLGTVIAKSQFIPAPTGG